MVNRQNIDRDARDLGEADQDRPLPLKVFRPDIASRVKQANKLACLMIESGQVGALVTIASQTRQSQIIDSRHATMLTRDDMIDGKCPHVSSLRHLAILASIPRALPNCSDEGRVHT